MKRIKITLPDSRFFDSVIKEARRREIEIYVRNKKKGVLTCDLDYDFVDWLTNKRLIVSEMYDPKRTAWRVYPAKFRLASATFVHKDNGQKIEIELGLPRHSLADGCELNLEQKKIIESRGHVLESVPPGE